MEKLMIFVLIAFGSTLAIVKQLDTTKFIPSQWRHMDDMVSQIASNSTFVQVNTIGKKQSSTLLALCGGIPPRWPMDSFNSSPPEQNGRHFADDIFRSIFVNEKFCILIKVSLNFVPEGPIDNNQALVWMMAWRRIGPGRFEWDFR